jgi:hypothetical protein
MQLLPTLRNADTDSLQALNRRLWAWVEGEYHRSPHRGLGGITPLDAWAERARHVEHVGGRTDLDDMFLFEEKRKVGRDRTVSLHGTIYEVDAILVGTTVALKYDPQRVGSTIQVWAADGHRHSDAKPVDVHANCWVKRDKPTEPESIVSSSASTLRLSDMQTPNPSLQEP